MADSLKSKTIRALSWSFLESVGYQGIQFVIGIILARLLLPAQFGLVAMLSIFIVIGQLILESGFGAALIQKQNPTQTDICSIFYFNIAIGIIVAGIMCIGSPWIAEFYKQPVLGPLTRLFSLTIIVNSFCVVQNTLLTKQINFKARAQISVISAVLSGGIGIGMAASGFGVWSLAFQQIASVTFRTLFLWIYSNWRPSMKFSLASLRGMFAYGSRMFATILLYQIFENIYLVVIGRLFSAADLGYFSRAKSLQEMPSYSLSSMVDRVTFPVFSTIQDNPDRLKRGVKTSLTVIALINFPMMVGIALMAHPLIITLLTEKWASSIPYLRLLCVLGFLFPLHAINLNILKSVGRSDLILRLEIIKKVLVVINILVTWHFGITAMIYGMIVISVVTYFLNSIYSGKLIGYPTHKQLLDLLPYFGASMAMGTGLYAIGRLLFSDQWLMLLIQSCSGVIIYIVICKVLKLTAFEELWNMGWRKAQLPGKHE